MSKMGFCSRSRAVQLVIQGRVTLNGSRCRNVEALVRVPHDLIAVDGSTIVAAAKHYLMLNKPRGVVTTAADERGRPTVYDCLRGTAPEGALWLAPIGRLDQASEGLLLLTNDSEWGARISAPATHLEKTYHVQIAAIASYATIATLEKGIWEDGELLHARSVRLLRHGRRNYRRSRERHGDRHFAGRTTAHLEPDVSRRQKSDATGIGTWLEFG